MKKDKKGRLVPQPKTAVDEEVYSVLNLKNIIELALYNIATNRFIWHNLPNDMPSTVFESMLISNGCACVADTPEYGIVTSGYGVQGGLNPRAEPTRIILQSFSTLYFSGTVGDYNNELTYGDYVCCYNNNTRTSLIPLIDWVSNAMAHTLNSAFHNSLQQKFGLVFKGRKDAEVSFNIIKGKIEAGESAFFIRDTSDPAIDMEGVQVYNDGIPFVCDKLISFYKDLFNLFLTQIGVNNIPNESKKERLLVDEVNANNQALGLVGDSMFRNRLQFAEEANKWGDLKISVEENPNLDVRLPLAEIAGGDEYE